MGRSREFDEDCALDAVKQIFWTKGFAATSLADLEQATALRRGSLYNAFGDKQALYETVLHRYLEEMAAVYRQAAASPAAPGEALESLLARLITMASEAAGPKCGCFAVNSITELGRSAGAVAEMLDAHLTRITGYVAAIISRGQQAGVIRTDQPADALARWFTVFTFGVLSGLRGPLEPAAARAMAAMTVRLLS